MDFETLVSKRCSVRNFDGRPIEKDVLEKILQAGRLAPTAGNYQPQRVLLITSGAGREKLKSCTKFHYNAPAALLVCYDKEECWKRGYDGKASGDVDASIVTTHMMLAAAALGVGTTWVMHFDPSAMREKFAIPETVEPAALLVMGYPAEDAAPSPSHAQRKALEETLFYESF